MKKINLDFLTGSDPEVFLKDGTGKAISSIGLIGGTKTDPIPMDKYGFFCQEDNVLAEFNIPPSKNRHEFIYNINRGLALLKNRLPLGIDIDISPYRFFDKDQLESKESEEFGCMPDFNCWTKEENAKPCSTGDGLRTAGGHISVGYNDPKISTSISLARWMDALIAVPSIHMSDENPRRALYGKRGSMRTKEFGMEYRTVSNFWLKTTERISWVYDQLNLAVDMVNEGIQMADRDEAAIELAVNNNNRKAADWLINKYDIKLI